MSLVKLNLLGGLLILTMSGVVASAGMRSNYFWQPQKGLFYAQGDIQKGSFSAEYTNKASGVPELSETKSSSFYILTGGYGLTEQWAVRARIFTGQLVAEQDYKPGNGSAKYVGLGDLQLEALNTTAIDPDLNIHYGVSVGISPGNKKSSSATEDGNLYSGGLALAPYFGISSQLEVGHLVGAKFVYDIKMERKEDKQNETPVTTDKIVGGNVMTLEGFYEYHSTDYLIGASFGMNSISSVTRRYALSTQGEESTSGYLQIPIGIYGTYFVNSQLAVLGQYKYISNSNHDVAKPSGNVNQQVSKIAENQIQASLRYEF